MLNRQLWIISVFPSVATWIRNTLQYYEWANMQLPHLEENWPWISIVYIINLDIFHPSLYHLVVVGSVRNDCNNANNAFWNWILKNPFCTLKIYPHNHLNCAPPTNHTSTHSHNIAHILHPKATVHSLFTCWLCCQFTVTVVCKKKKKIPFCCRRCCSLLSTVTEVVWLIVGEKTVYPLHLWAARPWTHPE